MLLAVHRLGKLAGSLQQGRLPPQAELDMNQCNYDRGSGLQRRAEHSPIRKEIQSKSIYLKLARLLTHFSAGSGC